MNPSVGARARRPWLATISRILPGGAALSGAARGGARAFRATMLSWVTLASCVVLLTGCGFHLQGNGALPESSRKVRIVTADEVTPFAVELRRAIERSGGQVTSIAAEADIVIRIQRDRSGRRVLSVSARNTPQEYEIYYSIEYSVDRGGQEVLERQPLELVRNMSFEDSQLLAKDREEVILREAMARDIAMLVTRRLESL
jgi:LPS-assembly lipoprotein